MAQKKSNESSTNNNSYLSKPRWIVREDGSKERHMIGYLQPKKEKRISQEDRELLLKDLCARLPYGIKGLHRDKVEEVRTIDGRDSFQNYSYGAWFPIETFKPYLRPMSSMTEEERLYFHRNASRVPILVDEEKLMVKEFWGYTTHLLDWLLEHHFDYRGLIEKGLALEAPEGIYKTE